MAAHPLPSPELLRQLLRYEPDTGLLFWREFRAEHLSHRRRLKAGAVEKWNRRHCGQITFQTKHGCGYLLGFIQGHNILAHRAIWAIQTGEWPNGIIDHINHDRADNRWNNLRLVSAQGNARNRRHKPSRSGQLGVHWHNLRQKWQARITVSVQPKRVRSLGLFDSLDDAIAARKEAEALLGYHANHGQ